MRRGLAALLIGSALAALVACSTFSGDTPPAPVPDDAGTPAAPPVVEPEPIDSGLTPDAAPPCAQAILVNGAFHDNAFMGIASPTQKRPDVSVCNMNVGRCLFSFDLPAEGIDAITTARAFEIRLTLTRALASEECGPTDDSPCGDQFRADGDLIAFPVRSDWQEPMVTWNNRTDKEKWGLPGADGAADIGKQCGNQHVLAGDDKVVVLLDPLPFKDSFLKDGLLAIRTSFSLGPNRRPFNAVMSTKPDHRATPYAPASLAVLYCP